MLVRFVVLASCAMAGCQRTPTAAHPTKQSPAAAALHKLASRDEPLRWVNPMIGTAGRKADYGGAYPGVTRPFGMTQWTAMTRRNKISVCPYQYADHTIRGFIGTHQPAIWMGDYGYMTVTPGTGPIAIDAELPFRHEDEVTGPHYYAVDLMSKEGPIRAELAATERAGFMRFTFPTQATPHVVIEAIKNDRYLGWVRIDPNAREIVGYNPDRHSAHLGPELPGFKGYFVARFDRPFATYGTWDGNHILRESRIEQKGVQAGAYVTFAPGGQPVQIKIGTSFIDLDQARANLDREIPAWDFAATRDAGRDAWNAALRTIEVRGGTDDQKTIFYTALYHALLFPRLFSEYGRYYSAFDDRVHNGVSYNDYSLWDTFRAEHPLLLLVAPKQSMEMITALLQMADEGGRLPIWPNPTETNIMLGTHAECVIADAYAKGMRDFDVKRAYAAARKEATEPPPGDTEQRWEDRLPWTGPPAPPQGRGFEARGGLTYYDKLGYVPADRTEEAVSRTVEFGIDDYCTAQLARDLAPTDYEMLMRRSRNYQNLWHAPTRMLRARNSDGAFSPSPTDGFTEGSPWTYLFGAMHDVPGMIQMMGGAKPFVARLDENFDRGYYRHDNEPGHHYPYLYNYAGEPWKTQQRVREILATQYTTQPDGLIGNDDCGQMSAWYILSALGFYPVSPGSAQYAVGSPLFDEATLHLKPPAGNGTLVVRARNQAPANVYVQSVTLNGTPLTTPFIPHASLVTGSAVLEFTLGPKPNPTLWK